MRMNIGRQKELEYVWAQKYDYSKATRGINICGAKYPEGKLSESIEVIVNHTDPSVTIGFGSTLDQDPNENSFGVSGLEIYII
jgi:hypothetical protein